MDWKARSSIKLEVLKGLRKILHMTTFINRANSNQAVISKANNYMNPQGNQKKHTTLP